MEAVMDDKDGLTEQERAALAEEEGEQGYDSQTEQLLSNGADGTGNDGATGEQGTETPADDKTPSRDDGKAPEGDNGPDAAQVAGQQEQQTEQPAAPILPVEGVEEAKAALAEIPGKKEELFRQFDDGEITAREYQQQLDVMNKQERDAELTVREADMAARMETTRLQQQWTNTVQSFLNQNADYKTNPRLYRALDQEVRDIAATPEGANMTGVAILHQAHKNLVDAGFVKAGAKPSREVNTDGLPPNLGHMPAAEMTETQDGKWAGLDRLASSNPLAYEEALYKMSDTERDNYLAGR